MNFDCCVFLLDSMSFDTVDCLPPADVPDLDEKRCMNSGVRGICGTALRTCSTQRYARYLPHPLYLKCSAVPWWPMRRSGRSPFLPPRGTLNHSSSTGNA
jgi:hypothetical protein